MVLVAPLVAVSTLLLLWGCAQGRQVGRLTQSARLERPREASSRPAGVAAVRATKRAVAKTAKRMLELERWVG